MKCQKCNKEMDRDIGGDLTFPGIVASVAPTLKGVEVTVRLEPPQDTQENIDYFNKQLGKYSNGKGECHIAICYECYIDNLFSGYPVILAKPIINKKGGNRQ